jgi:hypothetical protein
MIRRLVGRLSGLFGDSELGSSEDDSEEPESGFMPSRLDASVLFAHGMNSTEAAEEIARMEDRDLIEAKQKTVEAQNHVDEQSRQR